MSSLKMSDQQYILSLDSLDLSLLSQYVQRPANEKRALWSKPFMDGDSVYCQVQIPSDVSQDEESYIVPSESCICHICNIEIPRQYFKQHTKSKVHESYKKLTEKTLENVLKQIKYDIDSVNSNEEHDQFFCETCCKVVLLKNKRQHNTSKYHLKSIENQKVANNFIEIYVNNKEDNKNIKNEVEPNNNESNIEYESGSDTDWNFDSESENEVVTNFNHATYNSNSICKMSEMTNNETYSNVLKKGKENSNFQTYLKEMIKKYKLDYELPTIEDNSIVIVTPKGYKEKISIDVFHGYKKTSDGVFCQLCNIRVLADINLHSHTEDHVKNMIQPIDDNFTRGTLYIPFKGWQRHCVLCNIVVTNESNHALSLNHKKYHNTNVPKEKEPTVIKTATIPKKTHCDVCKIHVDTHNFPAHLTSKKHKSKVKLARNNSPPVAVPNITPPQDEAKNNKTFCEVCKVKIPLGGMAVHVVGKSHKNKYFNSVPNVLKEIKTEVNKLTVVDNKLSLKSDLSKTKSNEVSKQEKLVEYNKQMFKVSTVEVTCLICDSRVPALDNNIIEHVEGVRHKKAVEVILKENKIVKSSFKSYYCEVCKTHFDNFVAHVNVHNKVKDITNGAIDKNILRKYVYEEPLSGDESLSIMYRTLYKKLLEVNKIVRLNSVSLYCGVCSINLSRTTEIDHMFGERHRSLLK